MQPFDALTIKVILKEAKPFLVGRRVERVSQVGRDEVVVTLRSRNGMSHLLLSAHAAFGRLCLINMPPVSKRNNPPGFCMLLRKHLSGATLVAVEQVAGERVVDLIFSCQDEVGQPSHKVLTAEIMGRHSNLICWDRATNEILGASHMVTREMSRQREVLPGLKYVRPPAQEKPNIFQMSKEQFLGCAQIRAALPANERESTESWLVANFTGLGSHLAVELVESTAGLDCRSLEESLWERIQYIRDDFESRPAVRADFSRFSVVSWWTELEATLWKTYPSANDMVEEYYRYHDLKERCQQLRDRLQAELKGEAEKLEGRLAAAAKYTPGTEKDDYKKFADLILAHLAEIGAGQAELVCQDLYAGNGHELKIPLNPNLSGSQNAQNYYRLFAKARSRAVAANSASEEANSRLKTVHERLEKLAGITTLDELEALRDLISPPRQQPQQPAARQAAKTKPKHRLLSVTSSDGWTIFMGRNRQENDELIARIAQPHDIWMHILGAGGAHVLIKVPSTKQDPPARTLQEAAQAAARLSKAGQGGKVQVVYTQCRYVRKVAKNKPGVVRYENEKTLEVDTARPMPEMLRQLFAARK
jgi:predicted ribosome quality control (RQC) complex YloA/Tae2 family protein